tara:strand:- start:2542 stop:3357 length:816 start_codon:yes stop_codon:yes gene_type:complete
MRQHGRANVSINRPRAFAVCDRCGALYNHDQLQWQYQWVGVKLQNLYRLVCQSCLDVPQEQLRTIVLPPDPVPIANARPESYVADDNPMSALGASPVTPARDYWQYSNQIGNLTCGGGVPSAFNGAINKPSWQSATNTISNSSYNNYVGINWTGNVSNLNMPSSMLPPVVRHSLTSFTAYAPSDRGFLGSAITSYVVQSSPVNTTLWGAWTTISSGVTTGSPGETISGNCTGGLYQFHRIAFLGDQTNYVSVAQVEFNTAQVGTVVTGGSS